MLVKYVQNSIDNGRAVEEKGQREPNVDADGDLLDAIEEMKFDCALGGGRRDEEKARAKERFFPHWMNSDSGIPKSTSGTLEPVQRQKAYWRTFQGISYQQLDGNGCLAIHSDGKHSHAKSLFHPRTRVFCRDGVWLATAPFMQLKPGEKAEVRRVRCRTIGDITCTGVTLSAANTLEEIIQEVASSRVTERGGRADDKRSEAAMEDRKKEGYF